MAALVDDLLHLGSGNLRKSKGADRQVIALGAHGDLRDVGVHHGAFEFREPGGFGLDRIDDDRYCGVRHNRSDDGNLGARRGRQNSDGQQRSYAQSREFGGEFHSISSVAMRSDFRKRTSCGVMVRRAMGLRSGSWSKDSWST